MMKSTERAHKTIDSYLSTLKTDSDKLTQFYSACIIAKRALIEIDKKNRIMEYSQEIKTAYNDWMSKIEAEPRDEWEPDFKSTRRASKRAGDKFEKLCVESGLNYVRVAGDLCDTKLKIN